MGRYDPERLNIREDHGNVGDEISRKYGSKSPPSFGWGVFFLAIRGVAVRALSMDQICLDGDAPITKGEV